MTSSRTTAAVPLGPVRRTLLVDVDGRTDTTTDVVWLQGPVLFVDLRVPGAPLPVRRAAAALRGPDDLASAGDDVLAYLLAHEGFAGRFHLDGDSARWERLVDVRPPTGVPDEGTLVPDGDVLVETGVHAPYVEHWRPDEPAGPVAAGHAAAVLLSENGSGCTGVIVRVGDRFGVARGRSTPLPVGADLRTLAARPATGPAPAWAGLLDCEISLGRIDTGGRWTVEASTLPWRVGADLAPSHDGRLLTTADTGPTTRTWHVVEHHGDALVPTLARTGGRHGLD